jgi:long-chain acyl-CoA synthetase
VERPWYRHWPTGVPKTIDYPRIPVERMLRQAADGHGDQVATVFYGARLTYREIDDAADRFAAGLRRLGVQIGDRVGLIVPNSPAFLIAFFGVQRVGGIVVQTNPLYTPWELARLYADAGATVVVCLDLFLPNVLQAKRETGIREVVVADLKDYLPAPLAALYPLRRRSDLRKAGHWPLETPREPWLHRFRELLEGPAERGKEPQSVDPDDVAVLQYTGGTTGTPKGAMLTHRNLIANAYQCASWVPGTQPGQERTLIAIPLFHIYGLMAGLMVSLRVAATMLLVPDPRDLKHLLKVIDREHPTLFPAVPTLYVALMGHPRLGKVDMRGISACLSGAAPLPVEVRRRWESLTGGRLVEGYGLTEATTVVCANPLTKDGLVKEGVGIPFPDTDVRIVDLEEGARDVPPGEAGELLVRGPQVMRGYWNQPEETAATLRDGWLHTGDIAQMDEDGYLYIIERKKDLIIASGFNVYPREVEEVLYMHPAVFEAAAIGVPDAYRGETVKAFVALKPGATATDQEIIAFCRERLAAFRVPRQIEFRSELPKSAIGKVLRRTLRDEDRAKRAAVAPGPSR